MHNFSNTITSETMQQRQRQQQQRQRQRDHSKSNLETSKIWNGHFRGKKRLLSISISKVFAKFKSQKNDQESKSKQKNNFCFCKSTFCTNWAKSSSSSSSNERCQNTTNLLLTRSLIHSASGLPKKHRILLSGP